MDASGDHVFIRTVLFVHRHTSVPALSRTLFDWLGPACQVLLAVYCGASEELFCDRPRRPFFISSPRGCVQNALGRDFKQSKRLGPLGCSDSNLR